MRRRLFFASIAILVPTPARGDGAETSRDPALALTFRASALHTDDATFDATWVRPATLGASGWILRSPRRWLNGLQAYGAVGVETAWIAYRENPEDYQEGLSGIHRADIAVAAQASFTLGGRLALYDDGRFRLLGFGDAAFQAGAAGVEVRTLLIDLDGLKIDVAKAVRENAEVTFKASAFRLGFTAAVGFDAGGCRWMPYLSAGWLRYDATLGFTTDPRLDEALRAFGIGSSVFGERVVSNSNPFVAPGVRLDLSRAWSLEASALLGRYDGTWVSAGSVGLAWRFGPRPPH